jgi:signal peptidase II
MAAVLRLLGRPALWFWLLAAAVVAADQGSKAAVVEALRPGESVQVVPGILSLSLRSNRGAAFGALAHAGIALVFIAIGVIALLTAYGPRAAGVHRALGAGLACELGGAAGNLSDRVLRGSVVDFVDIHIWPVFNVADIAIVVGAVLIGYFIVHEDPRRRDREESDATGGDDDAVARIVAPRSPLAEEDGAREA